MEIDIEELRKLLEEEFSTNIIFNNIVGDGTFQFDCDFFHMTFFYNFQENEFVIKNLDSHKPGIGGKLIDIIEEFCINSNIEVLRGENMLHNAIGFAEKKGFEQYGDDYKKILF